MFKTTLTALCLILTMATCNAEEIKMSVDNTHPRVGETVTLTFETTFLSKVITKDLPAGVETSREEYTPESSLEKRITFSKEGKQTLGPFTFTFNGTSYTSNTINVIVGKAIDETKEGLYIRHFNSDDGYIMIVEQIYKPSPKKEEATPDFSSGDFDLSSLSLGAFQENGSVKVVEGPVQGLSFQAFNTISRSAGNDFVMNPDGSFAGPSLMYQKRFYHVRFTDTYTGKFILKKEHLTNLPKGMKVPKVIIQR